MDILQYIGVDYHPYQQTIAFVDEAGEIKTRRFFHTQKKALKQFYQRFPNGSVVGVEATGQMAWFEKMLATCGLQLQIGDPRRIRKMALSPHKNDRRDAEHILDLLLIGRFPTIEPRSEESQRILSFLNYRHSLVKSRTAVANQLQAMARSFGLARFGIKAKLAETKMLAMAEEAELIELIESRFRVHRMLTAEIDLIRRKLSAKAVADEPVKLLQTHPGIGELTALCAVHTLGDVGRFGRKEQVTAFVGLVPLDESSGEKKRIGKISKHGSKLLRYLLGQAGQKSFADERLKQFYQRVSRRRGNAKAKVAVARKLLERCYLMLRDNIDYEEFRRRGEVGLPGLPAKRV
ncbi:MAG: IS110 family transposase [Aridibacter sp.]